MSDMDAMHDFDELSIEEFPYDANAIVEPAATFNGKQHKQSNEASAKKKEPPKDAEPEALLANGAPEPGSEFISESVPDARPVIMLTTEEHEINQQAAAALATDPNLFQRGNLLVRTLRAPKQTKKIERDPDTATISMAPFAIVSERLTAVTRFVAKRKSKKGDVFVSAEHPPTRLIRGVMERGEWPGMRILEGIVDNPMMRLDGSILDTPGYDEASGLLYEPRCTIAPLPSPIFKEDVDEACEALAEVVADFPFLMPEHRAAWFAAVLTPFVRFAIDGPAPLFAIDANIRGCGKGLLCETISLIATGRRMTVTAAPHDDCNEFRKRITSIALAADQLVLLDNIKESIGCPSLDAVLTCVFWEDRLLGRNEMTRRIPMRTTWFCTGNNIEFEGDLSRRVCHIRLQSPEECPEEKQGFRHPRLIDWIRQERSRLVRAALILLKGYCDAGKPDMGLKPWGSFEEWSDMIRSTVVWAGLPDPGETRHAVRERSDSDAKYLPAILNGVEFLDGLKRGIPVSQLLKMIDDPQFQDTDEVKALCEALCNLCSLSRGNFPSAKSIGKKFSNLEGRVVRGKCLTSHDPNNRGIWLWKVEEAKT
jgi:hypothetical protein